MQTVSANFLAAAQGSNTPVYQVDLWYGGAFVATLPTESVSVAYDANQNVQGTCSVVVLDADGLYTPASMGDPLTPFGGELNIKAGFNIRGVVETVSLGWFPIWSISVEDAWSSMQDQLTGNTALVRRGSRISVSGRDRMQKVADFKFLVPTAPNELTAWAEIAYLVKDILPTTIPSFVTTSGDIAIPTTLTYGEDRLEAVKALAAVFAAEPVMTASGALTLRKINPTQDATNTAPTFGWTVNITDYKKTLTRDGVNNIVVVRGKDSNGVSVITYAIQDSGPTSFYGAMGPRPVFYDTELVNTRQGLQDYANAQLATTASQNTQTVPIKALPNPAIELGDYVSFQTAETSTALASVTCRIIGYTIASGNEMSVNLSMPKNWIA